MPQTEYQYCSWCFHKTHHRLVSRCYLSRNEYQCSRCGNYTVQCRYCKNMATYRPDENRCSGSDDGFFKEWIQARKDNWASELCAEHDGTVADFSRLEVRLTDLANYEVLFRRSSVNLMKTAHVAGGVIAGIAVFCPLTYLAVPEIAAALSAAGLIGQGVGGAVVTALSSMGFSAPALIMLGPTGVAVISAAGGALGGLEGGRISNAYFGDIKNFKIRKVKRGEGAPVLFVNGFANQMNESAADWSQGVSRIYSKHPQYLNIWESKTNTDIYEMIGKGSLKKCIEAYTMYLMKRGATKIARIAWLSFITDLMANPMAVAFVQSQKTGFLLADLIARTHLDDGIVLMGHSMGARVIFYLLTALATKKKSPVKDVYLLGGAVDSRGDDWQEALKAVNGKLYNCYSVHDSVLQTMKGITLLSNQPVGLCEIQYDDPKIVNLDVSDIVKSHFGFKDRLKDIMDRIHCE